MSEEQLREEFARELAAREAPPIGSLIEDALARGHRLRRRRRAVRPAAALTGVALAAAIALGVRSTGGPPAVWRPADAPPARATVTDPLPTTWQAVAFEVVRTMEGSHVLTIGPDDLAAEVSDHAAVPTAISLVQARLHLVAASGSTALVVLLMSDQPEPTCTDAASSGSACSLAVFAGATVRARRFPATKGGALDDVTVRYADGLRVAVSQDVPASGGPTLGFPDLYRIASDPMLGMTMTRDLVLHGNQAFQIGRLIHIYVRPNGSITFQ
jgi:hypothetical protein